MQEVKHSWIALCGCARAGKDEAGKALVAIGYTRCCLGDIIKQQVDPLVRQYCGFSAFTENNEEKSRIRPLLETWGDVNYDMILDQMFKEMPVKAVNTRLVRVREAIAWKKNWGVIVEISRPGCNPVSEWEANNLSSLRDSGLIDRQIWNDGSIEDLHQRMQKFARHLTPAE